MTKPLTEQLHKFLKFDGAIQEESRSALKDIYLSLADIMRTPMRSPGPLAKDTYLKVKAQSTRRKPVDDALAELVDNVLKYKREWENPAVDTLYKRKYREWMFQSVEKLKRALEGGGV